MKGPAHHVDTYTLFSKTIGTVSNRKNRAERAVDPTDDPNYYGCNCSFIPLAAKPSAKGINKDDGFAEDHRNAPTACNAKPSAKNY